MKLMCETNNYLIIATEDNRLIFVNSNLKVIKSIKFNEQITSLDTLQNARHLLIGTD